MWLDTDWKGRFPLRIWRTFLFGLSCRIALLVISRWKRSFSISESWLPMLAFLSQKNRFDLSFHNSQISVPNLPPINPHFKHFASLDNVSAYHGFAEGKKMTPSNPAKLQPSCCPTTTVTAAPQQTVSRQKLWIVCCSVNWSFSSPVSRSPTSSKVSPHWDREGVVGQLTKCAHFHTAVILQYLHTRFCTDELPQLMANLKGVFCRGCSSGKFGVANWHGFVSPLMLQCRALIETFCGDCYSFVVVVFSICLGYAGWQDYTNLCHFNF